MKRLARRLAGHGRAATRGGRTSASPYAVIRELLAGVEAPVVFDVGANIGRTAEKFRRWLPDATVYAFEPYAASFASLRERAESDPAIRAYPWALAESDGERAFHSNLIPGANSLLAIDDRAGMTWGAGRLVELGVVNATVRTIDSVLAELALEQIDVLKIDVQGAEPLVIAGAANACATGRIRIVYTEIITQPTYDGQRRLDESLAAFYSRGFDLFGLYNFEHAPDGRLCQLDALFTRNG